MDSRTLHSRRSSALAYDLTPAAQLNSANAGFGLSMVLALFIARLATLMRQDELGSCLAIQLAAFVLTLVMLGTAVRTTNYCVVGVSDRQTFAIREYAGHFERRIGQIRANTCGILSRQVETRDGKWRLIEVAGKTGWADVSFLQPEVSPSPSRWFGRTTFSEVGLLIVLPLFAVGALVIFAADSKPARLDGSSALRMAAFGAALALLVVSLIQAGTLDSIPVRASFAYVPAAVAFLIFLTLLVSLPAVRGNHMVRYAVLTARAVGVPAVLLVVFV